MDVPKWIAPHVHYSRRLFRNAGKGSIGYSKPPRLCRRTKPTGTGLGSLPPLHTTLER